MSIDSAYPPIGSQITNQNAYQLCQQYGLIAEAHRLSSYPNFYRSWTFDGVSGLPDHILHLLGNGFNITYQCALPHDLAYAYGQLGDSRARCRADRNFRENLINLAAVNPVKAYIAWLVVRILGSSHIGLSFSWSFADKRAIRWTDDPLEITL